ncbi:MAG: SMP-30/gluconolactonase/LRE family protein [Planctomycetaceae bacterium]|nr:SMP-30/gluconolactonase/LRE family protein [Planctomycetaceae bacterium]
MLSLVIVITIPALAQSPLDSIIEPNTKAVILGTGYGFCEGPAVDGVGNIYFSDGAKDSIHFYAYARPVQLFTDKSTDANGMMMNAAGELVVCEGAAFQVVAINTRTGERRVLTKGIDDKRFNEPNDITIDKWNGFYFTDPNYRHRKQETVMKEDVYYVAADGTTTRVSTVCKKPNGILLSADSKILYLADNGTNIIYRYDVTGAGKIENEKEFTKTQSGPDGMTIDKDGNLYIACGGNGVEIFKPNGEPLGTIGKQNDVSYVSNVVFGGPGGKCLYMTSGNKFLGIQTKTTGGTPVVATVVP